MAVRQKLKDTSILEISEQNESEVAALINKGGSVAKDMTEQEPTKNVQLRLTDSFISEIDASCNKRFPKPSRHSWMLEAFAEKLQREQTEQTS